MFGRTPLWSADGVISSNLIHRGLLEPQRILFVEKKWIPFCTVKMTRLFVQERHTKGM